MSKAYRALQRLSGAVAHNDRDAVLMCLREAVVVLESEAEAEQVMEVLYAHLDLIMKTLQYYAMGPDNRIMAEHTLDSLDERLSDRRGKWRSDCNKDYAVCLLLDCKELEEILREKD